MTRVKKELEELPLLLDSASGLAREWLDALPSRRAGALASADELRESLEGNLSENGEAATKVVQNFSRSVEPGLVASPGPRYFGFVTGGSLPAALVADWLASAWDQNGFLYASSPAIAVAEEIVASWVLDLLGLPPESSVGFVSGCQMANFTALAAARHEVLRGTGWDVESDGLSGAPRITVVAGEEAHGTIFTALRMLGLGEKNVILVPTDGQGRMIPDALREALKNVSGPLIVCLQSGNLNTGAFDPCGELIPLAREKGAWVHVDGAFGLWGLLLPELEQHTAGIALADSWATDAHKWLNVPYDSGLVMVRNAEAHGGAMMVKAPLLAPGEDLRDPSAWVPESSRRGRVFPLYCALRSLGRSGLSEMVARNCAQARLFASLLGDDPLIEILNDVVLNQVLVAFRPPEGVDADEFTRRVIAAVQREGTCWAGGNVRKGRAVMRISVSNWSTEEEDIRLSAAAIRRVLSGELESVRRGS
ncbi:MAG: aspartate aminotransferase family protein [Synergistaceae bacterium]|nr:aspartate aminotransferase family protein [Synergistaceae bacterium]